MGRSSQNTDHVNISGSLMMRQTSERKTGIELSKLTVEGRISPLGLDDQKPRFGWLIASDGPIRYANLYDGTLIDYRMQPAQWMPVQVVAAPCDILRGNVLGGVKAYATESTISLTKTGARRIQRQLMTDDLVSAASIEIDERPRVGDGSSWTSQAADPSAGMGFSPHRLWRHRHFMTHALSVKGRLRRCGLSDSLHEGLPLGGATW